MAETARQLLSCARCTLADSPSQSLPMVICCILLLFDDLNNCFKPCRLCCSLPPLQAWQVLQTAFIFITKTTLPTLIQTVSANAKCPWVCCCRLMLQAMLTLQLANALSGAPLSLKSAVQSEQLAAGLCCSNIALCSNCCIDLEKPVCLRSLQWHFVTCFQEHLEYCLLLAFRPALYGLQVVHTTMFRT